MHIKKYLPTLFIFFCLSISCYAATPTLGTVTPSSGTIAPDAARSFACIYSDASGWAHLKEANLLISTSTANLANSVYLYYDQDVNLLYLRDDSNTAWLGGFAPGSVNIIENSQVKLNCISTTLSGSGTTMTVTFSLTFKAAYSGKIYNLYTQAKDDTALVKTWTSKGTYAVDRAPTLGTISPASGTGTVGTLQLFTTTFSDLDGWQNIQLVYLLVNSSTATTNCPYAYYDQNLNKLYLRNDANTAWLGGFAPGSINLIENSYAKLDCSQTTVTGSGATMTVSWALIFKTPFTGAKNTYLYVKDDANSYVNYTKKGTWTIPNNAPQTGAITPSLGSSIPDQDFPITTIYSDPDGWLNLQYAYFLVSTSSTTLTNCLYAYYDQNTNKLYLRNDANTSWLGGYVPGAANVIENSSAKINCSSTVVIGNGTNLTVKWSVIFKPVFLGQKNVYSRITDDGGGSISLTQKGTWFAMDSGTAIGQNGGEVLSSDGKIRLTIPPGALNDLIAINIAPVSAETLEGAAPQGTTMLSAVDCKPYGLVFSSPVTVVYNLSQAEIPGTPVELGLYDSIEKKINPTGQTSAISSDGYSVTFSLQHFSTYAALMNLVPQSAPIGAGVKIPLPDMFTGAFGHAIQITIPPGRKGMQPSLGLTYHSSNSNSWVGLGFSLNPGYIVRSTKLGPPTYNDAQDTFYFMTDNGTTELVHLIDNLYEAKIESSFNRFYKQPDDSWKIVGKDGSVLTFGQTADSKEISNSGTFSWYVTRATDVNGNYIAFSYTKDQGKVYLSRIDYTGNDAGTPPTNSVEFILESRDDIISSYVSTARIATTKRLKEIDIKVNSDLVWRYILTYTASPDTNRSLLTSVTQNAGDNKNLPVQRFTYQESH